MARAIVKGIQLPPDSTGKVTGAFAFDLYDDSDGAYVEVTIPVTAIVNADGEEIGSEILDLLTKIENHLNKISKSTEMQTQILGGN